MTTGQPPEAQLPPEVLEELLGTVCANYRIERADAARILEQLFAGRPALVREIARRHPREDITRLRDYKELVKQARKQIYYHLRQYQRARDQLGELKDELRLALGQPLGSPGLQDLLGRLLQTHVSTQERAPEYGEFYQQLFALAGRPTTIVDVGCGIHPLSYPFHDPERRLERYIALDRDAGAVELLRVYAEHPALAQVLFPVHVELAELDWGAYVPPGQAQADLALMLKVVPVVSRQSRELLPRLLQVPARRILVTASAEAMTKKTSISRREDRLLRDFIALSGRPILHDFRLAGEFGYLLGER